MDEHPAAPQEDLLPPAQRKAGQTAMIRAAMSHCVWGATTGGDIGKLFLLTMGGSAFQVGLLSTLTAAGPVGQLLGLRILPRAGKAKMVCLGDVFSVAPMLVLIGLAMFAGPGPRIVGVTIAAYSVVTMLRSTGQTGWWPLLQDVTAGETLGAFFAKLRTYLRFVEILLPMAVGAYLGRQPTPGRFLVPFLVGMLALGVGAAFVLRAPERAISPPEIGLLLRLRLAFKSRNVRNYVAYVSQAAFILGLVNPFWVVMLNRYRGLPNNYTVWLTTAGAIGHMASLKFWGELVDRHGGRPALSICVVGLSLTGLAWLVLPAGGAALIAWAMLFYVAWGFFNGGLMMGRTWTMLSVVPTVYQADGLTLAWLSMAGGAALGSLLGGLAFDWLAQHGGVLLGLDVRVLYLCLVQLGLLAVWPAKHRLSEFRTQTPARELLNGLWRRLFDRADEDQR